jgi:hypothetical protein
MCISLPMAAGMGALWLGTQDTLQEQASSDLQAMTQNVSHQIEQQMAMDLTHLKAWSTMPMMQDVLIADQGGELSQALTDLNRSYSDFASLTITNAQGAVVATTDAALRKADLSGMEGIHAAVSGRATQSGFMKIRRGAAESIQFTVPLVASYDRQTVIGTLTGTIDFGTLVRRVVQSSPLNVERRGFVLTQGDTTKIVWSSRSLDSVSDEIGRIDPNRRAPTSEIVVGGETWLAAHARSTGKDLGKDPGFVAFGIEPTDSIYAAADKVSNIFLAISGLAAIVALFIAWQWSTPLVQISSSMSGLAGGRSLDVVPQLPRHNTFAPLVRALDTMREVKQAKDQLAAREFELIQARDAAQADARNRARKLQDLGRTLKDNMASIVALCDLINRENLQAAAGKRPTGSTQELSRSAVQLLNIVHAAIDTAEITEEEAKVVTEQADDSALKRLTA